MYKPNFSHQNKDFESKVAIQLDAVIMFGLRFAFFTHIAEEKRTVSKYVR